MKFLIVLLAILPCVVALTEQQYASEFTTFMHKYDKSYSHDEFQARYQIFKDNVDFITQHNAEEAGFSVAVNAFAAMSNEEYQQVLLGFSGDKMVVDLPLSPVVVSNEGLPTSVDWRKKGAVTHIKNQGQCGSCWSFSTTGSVEGSHKISGHTLVSLSEQQLVDCSDAYGNMGCDGGLMDDAFKYVIAVGGLETESEYPYHASDGTCKFNKADIAASIDGFHDVPSGSESALTKDIADIEPISVAIDASHSSFQFYSHGVYYEPDCSSTRLDHGVLAVGYGVDGSQDYYIVKNSWGTDWGMNGYIWMSRNRDNNCGIATMASYPCSETPSGGQQTNCPK